MTRSFMSPRRRGSRCLSDRRSGTLACARAKRRLCIRRARPPSADRRRSAQGAATRRTSNLPTYAAAITAPAAPADGAIFQAAARAMRRSPRARSPASVGDMITITLVEKHPGAPRATRRTRRAAHGSIGLNPPADRSAVSMIVKSSDFCRSVRDGRPSRAKATPQQSNSAFGRGHGDGGAGAGPQWQPSLVRGQKQLTLNRGDEFRSSISGHRAPGRHHARTTACLSTRVADAQDHLFRQAARSRVPAARVGSATFLFPMVSPF